MAGHLGTWRQLAVWCKSSEPSAGGAFIVYVYDSCMRQGEVDIVEGVNDQMPNLSSLHTSPGVYRFHRCLRAS